ncbi:MAG TPA: hypothetical protein VHN55_02705 [Sphingomicrobium sp.]|nr:hypothetical protein [Sphingomicrobium sp.]
MIDEIFDRSYQSGRAGLNAGIDRLVARSVRATRDIFNVLERIQFDAPWTKRRHHAGCA